MEKLLSISKAAEMLGVHPTTLRLWTKKGMIPFHMTSGGHRRFLEEELRIWSEAQQGTFSPQVVARYALRKAQEQVNETTLKSQPWYQKLDEKGRETYEKAAYLLLESMFNAFGASEDENRVEAQAIGYEHASRAVRYRLSEVDALQVLIFFRSVALDAILSVHQGFLLPLEEVFKYAKKLLAFIDQAMLYCTEVYHQLSMTPARQGVSGGALEASG